MYNPKKKWEALNDFVNESFDRSLFNGQILLLCPPLSSSVAMALPTYRLIIQGWHTVYSFITFSGWMKRLRSWWSRFRDNLFQILQPWGYFYPVNLSAAFGERRATASLRTDRGPWWEPGGTQRYHDVHKCLCECVWMMRARPECQAGGISTPACDPLGFRYWWTNQWAHWGCRSGARVSKQHSVCVAVCVRLYLIAYVFMCTIWANAWSSLRRSDVHGFSTISKAICILVGEGIQNPRNPPVNRSHTRTDGFPNERGCVRDSPDRISCHLAGGLTYQQ